MNIKRFDTIQHPFMVNKLIIEGNSLFLRKTSTGHLQLTSYLDTTPKTNKQTNKPRREKMISLTLLKGKFLCWESVKRTKRQVTD